MASRPVLATFLAAAVCTIATAAATAQEVPQRTADGHPDFTGKYNLRGDRSPGVPPLQGTYQENYLRFRKAADSGKPVLDVGATCAGFGNFSTLTFNPYALEIVQTPDLMVWHFEGGDGVRRVYLDGRPHPVNAIRRGMGHSVAHFEGDRGSSHADAAMEDHQDL